MGPKRKIGNTTGASVVEYIVLIIMIMGALYIMKDKISGGIFGKYRGAEESFSFGRQYDAKRTQVCKQDVITFNGTAASSNFSDLGPGAQDVLKALMDKNIVSSVKSGIISVDADLDQNKALIQSVSGTYFDQIWSILKAADALKGSPTMGDLYEEDCYQTLVRRPIIPQTCTQDAFNRAHCWDTVNGSGCPQCRPGEINCFVCEEDIKSQCINSCAGK